MLQFSVLFPSDFSNKTIYAPLLFSTRAMFHTHIIQFVDILQTVCIILLIIITQYEYLFLTLTVTRVYRN